MINRFYCPSNGWTGVDDGVDNLLVDCGAGKYCPESSSSETNCPAGTYNPYTNGKSTDDCLPCQPGQYCSGTGNTSPSGSCAARYYCRYGASTNTPSYGLSEGSYDYGPCPQGYFCAVGTSDPAPCAVGYYGSSTYLTTGECTSCTQGSYCSETALTAVSGPCNEGYYCPTGTKDPRFF